MRKILSTLCIAMLCTTALAEGEQTTIDGSKVSKITFDGDYVNITYNDGNPQATFDMSEIIISFGGTSGIDEELRTKNEASKGYWFNLKGQKLWGKPSTKGVFINNGKKIVIK